MFPAHTERGYRTGPSRNGGLSSAGVAVAAPGSPNGPNPNGGGTVRPPVVWLARVLYYVLPNLAPFNVRAEVVHALPVGGRHVLYTLLYAAIYSGVLLTASIAIFRRRDFK